MPLYDWTLSVEIFCLILILILILNYYEKWMDSMPTSRLYQCCLWLSMVTVLVNIICVFTINMAQTIPLWVNLALNTLYFLLVVGLSTVIGYYLLYLITEHMYEKRYLRRGGVFQAALFLIYAAVLVYNLFSGVIFYFDDTFHYQRGPLINLGYVIMAMQLLRVVVCTLRNRCNVNAPIQRMMRILPPTILLLTIYQITYPDVLFNGTIIVSADLLLLLNFQSRRVEVDSLTCINNRSSFYHELSIRLAGGQQFQVLVVSLKQFTFINQHYGHPQGDDLLYSIAYWLAKVHKSGKAFRVGNVDFALMLPYTGMVAGEEYLKKVSSRFREVWPVGGSQVLLSARVAELIHTDQDWSPTEALEFLQYSLTLADAREDKVSPFDRSLFLHLERRRHILELVRKAIEKQSLQVWYQPVYRCHNGSFCAAEALLRLRDEDGTMVPTDLLISLAEQCGLLDDLTWLVLEEVCRFLGSGQAPWLESISINLSMQQFLSNELVDRLTGCLERHQVPPQRLKIEITERVLAEDIWQVRSTIQVLTDLGIRFYLDDFGVGYSNLSSVLKLPFSCIKLDHSLIAGFPAERSAASIVSSMLDVFHGMGFQVVTEGVETAEQAQALIAQGADWIQGYYYARPMPQDQLIPFLAGQAQKV